MKQFALVACFGAVGGLLVWLFGLFLGSAPRLGDSADILVSFSLGAGSSVVFVFLIANTDRTDYARILALAVLSGFFWEPVWHASRALIDRHIEDSRSTELTRSSEQALATAQALAVAEPDEREKLAQKLELEIQKAISLAGQIDSRSTLSGVRPIANKLTQLAHDFPSSFDKIRSAASLLALETGAYSPYNQFEEFQIAQASRIIDENQRLKPELNKASILPEVFGLTDNLTEASLASVNIHSNRLELFRSQESTASTRRPGRVPIEINNSDIPADRIQPLSINVPVEVTEDGSNLKWFSFAVPEKASYILEIRSFGGGLFAAVYSRKTLRKIAENNDSGGEQNPKITAILDRGEYIVRISDYHDGDLPPFSIILHLSDIE